MAEGGSGGEAVKTGVRVFLWLAGGLATVLLAGLLVTLVMVNRSREKLAEAKSELEARGETFDVLMLAPPKIPEKDSGASTTLAALREVKRQVETNHYSRFPQGRKETTPGLAEVMHRKPEASILGRKPSHLSWDKLANEYSALQPSLAALREALAHPVQAVNLDYTKGVNTKVDHVMEALFGAQCLASDAQLKLHGGNVPGAVDDIEALLRLTRLADQPLLICRLVQLSIEDVAQSMTWECLQAADPDPDSLVRLQKAWEDIPDRDVQATLRFERAGALPLFASGGFTTYRTGKNITALFAGTTSSPTWKEKLEEAQDRVYFETWQTVFRYEDERAYITSHQMFIDRLPNKDTGWQEVITASKEIKRSLESAGIGRLFSKMVAESVGGMIPRFGLNEAQRNLTIAAIAIRRYQLDHEGAVPLTLETLIPRYLTSVPRDPMDGQTLRYKTTDDSFLLYSVGLDGVDDGGDPTAPPGERAHSFLQRKDIVWSRAVP